MAEWRLRPRAARCAACGAPFAPGASGHSLLLPTGAGELERRDLCPACLAALPPATRDAAAAAWPFAVPRAAKRPAAEAGARPSAERVWRDLLAHGAPADAPALYVLSLLLERSRTLIERRVTADAAGRRVHLYESRASGDVAAVPEPDLAPEALPAIQRRVAELLEHGLPAARPRPKRAPAHPRLPIRRAKRRYRTW